MFLKLVKNIINKNNIIRKKIAYLSKIFIHLIINIFIRESI